MLRGEERGGGAGRGGGAQGPGLRCLRDLAVWGLQALVQLSTEEECAMEPSYERLLALADGSKGG